MPASPGQVSRRRAALAVGLLLCACHARTRRTPDDRIVVLIPNSADNPDPRLTNTSYDTKVSALVALGLTGPGEGQAPRMVLAESIDRVDDLTWDVVLRPGLRCSDGSPLTAADVAFTYQTALADDSWTAHQPLVERFVSVTAIAPLRVRFALVDRLATMLTDLEFGIVCRATADPGTGRFPGGRVVGVGPYRVVSLSHDRVLLERNPYYADPPPVREVELRVVPDQNAQALMLAGGSADLIQNTLRPDLIDDIDALDRVEVTSGHSSLLTLLMMHNQHPILSDVRVRRAIALAIDRERIIAAKFQGRAQLATGLLPPMHWAYAAEVDRYPYDPVRAGQLLDQAGYPDPDGPGGRPRFSLTYKTSADQFRVAVAHIIAQQLGEVGIDVTVRAFEFGTFLADVKAGNFELASMQSVPITDPDYLFTYFHSSRIPSPEHKHLHNRSRYRSARVDALTEAGRRELDRDRRRAIYVEVQQILAHDLPVVPLWHEDNVAVTNRDLLGYQVSPDATFDGLAATTKRTR